MIKRLYGQVENLLWIMLILLLPLTSFPVVSKLAGGTMVAPAAVIPLLLLAIFYVLPRLVRGAKLPAHVLPLLGLGLAALLSWGLSFFIDIPPFREINRFSNVLSALVTLLIGISFYFIATSWVDSPEKLKRIYFWLNLSGLVVIVWSLIQAGYWYAAGAYPDWMVRLQSLISTSGNLYNQRVTGLAFEPSWLGHQLVMVYIPYWLAATVRRTSAFTRRIFGVTLENVLLLASAAVLFLAFSRSAIISFLLMLSLLIIRGTIWVVRNVQNRIQSRQANLGRPGVTPALLAVLIWSGVVLIYSGLLAGGIFVMTRLDPRMTDLFSLLKQHLSFTELAYKLIFGERVVFWTAGLEVFSDHPLFGVGLANAGFFFPEKITPFGWTVAETYKLYYSSALPNTLSLWVRLLAETGILGFALMASWLVILWKSGQVARKATQPLLCTAGLAGQLALVALLMEGMSVDTFAFPYFWLTFGWLTAAAVLTRQTTLSRYG